MHTEATLRQFMKTELLQTATILKWTDLSHDAYSSALGRTLRRLQASSVEDVGSQSQLEAIAAIEIWRSVVNETVTAISYTADGGSFSLDSIHRHAVDMVDRLEREFSESQNKQSTSRSSPTGSRGIPTRVVW